MSELIGRYLAAVSRELPERERADIVAELRDELMSEIEGREAGLGRSLTPGELEAALLAFGHPLIVAGRYRRTQHLIGPAVFPFWWAAVKAGLVVVAAVYVVLIVVGVLAGGHLPGMHVPSPAVVLVFGFGAITMACALVERFGKPEILARWRPERLPPPHGKRASRFELLTEVGLGVVFLLWWIGVIRFSGNAPELGLSIALARVWDDWFWWIVGYAVVDIATSVAALVRPDQVMVVRWVVIWRSLLGAGILVAVFQAEQVLIVSGRASVSQDLFDTWMRGAILVAIAIFLGRAAVEAWRLRQDPHVGSAA